MKNKSQLFLSRKIVQTLVWIEGGIPSNIITNFCKYFITKSTGMQRVCLSVCTKHIQILLHLLPGNP